MKFFEWMTDYQIYRQVVPKEYWDKYEDFLPKRKKELEVAGVPPYRLLSEALWEEDGRPYYNVHPKLVSRLCKVDMTKIPSTLLKMPQDMRVVNVRFAEQHDDFTVKEAMDSDNVPKISRTSGSTPPGSFVHSVLMVDSRHGVDFFPGYASGRSVLFLMDFDYYNENNQPIYCMFMICPEEGLSLQGAIDEVVGRKGRGDKHHDEMLRNVLRLMTSIGFLADNPTLCEPDVLSKDQQEFAHANEDRREFLADRARRRGKIGYNIGTDLMFLGSQPMGEKRTGEGNGRELEYAHIRGGHPHLVRYGEGKKLVKLKWYAPTTVRPDKPFK